MGPGADLLAVGREQVFAEELNLAADRCLEVAAAVDIEMTDGVADDFGERPQSAGSLVNNL